MKAPIIRTCIACRKKIDISKNNKYLRLSKSKNNGVKVEKSSNKNEGRGAYICFDDKCIKKTIKKRLINRAFKKDVSNNIYDYIEKLV